MARCSDLIQLYASRRGAMFAFARTRRTSAWSWVTVGTVLAALALGKCTAGWGCSCLGGRHSWLSTCRLHGSGAVVGAMRLSMIRLRAVEANYTVLK